MSVSATTRPKRPGETAGRDYQFVDNTEFGLMVNRGDLLEHAKVFGHYYGTPRKAVADTLAAGGDVLFDIDWQGTQQLEESARDDLVSVRSEEHTSELQSIMRISYAVFCLKKKKLELIY